MKFAYFGILRAENRAYGRLINLRLAYYVWTHILYSLCFEQAAYWLVIFSTLFNQYCQIQRKRY